MRSHPRYVDGFIEILKVMKEYRGIGDIIGSKEPNPN